jgi:hypothetical protein
MSLKVYHVRGVHHQAVIFATSPEEEDPLSWNLFRTLERTGHR